MSPDCRDAYIRLICSPMGRHIHKDMPTLEECWNYLVKLSEYEDSKISK